MKTNHNKNNIIDNLKCRVRKVRLSRLINCYICNEPLDYGYRFVGGERFYCSTCLNNFFLSITKSEGFYINLWDRKFSESELKEIENKIIEKLKQHGGVLSAEILAKSLRLKLKYLKLLARHSMKISYNRHRGVFFLRHDQE